MLIYAEIHPFPRRSDLEPLLEELGGFHGFDVPDAPMGRPAPIPISIACMARGMYPSKPIIINQRLMDVNELHVRSLIKGAKMLGLDVAFTQGDQPKIGRAVGYLQTEDAVRLARDEGVRAGMMLSMLYPRQDVEKRMRSAADFFLVLNLTDPRQLTGLDTAPLIPYLLVETERNREWMRKLGQPLIREEELPSIVERLEEVGVRVVLLSIPRDAKAFSRLAKALKL